MTLSNRSASVTAPLTISFQVDLQNVGAKISVEIIVMSVARLRFKTYEGWFDKDFFVKDFFDPSRGSSFVFDAKLHFGGSMFCMLICQGLLVNQILS